MYKYIQKPLPSKEQHLKDEVELQSIIVDNKIVIYDIEVFSMAWSICFKEYDEDVTMLGRSDQIRDHIKNIYGDSKIQPINTTTISFAPKYSDYGNTTPEKAKVIIENIRNKATAELKEYIVAHKDHMLIGYNNLSYDKDILNAIILGQNPVWLNNFVIPFSNYFSDSFKKITKPIVDGTEHYTTSKEHKEIWGKIRLVPKINGFDSASNKNKGTFKLKPLSARHLMYTGWENNYWSLSSNDLRKLYTRWYVKQPFFKEQQQIIKDIPETKGLYISTSAKDNKRTYSKGNYNPSMSKSTELYNLSVNYNTRNINKVYREMGMLPLHEIDLIRSQDIMKVEGDNAFAPSLKSHAVRMGFSLSDLDSLSKGVVTFHRQLPFDIVTKQNKVIVEKELTAVKFTDFNDKYDLVEDNMLWKINLNYNVVDVLLTEHLTHKNNAWFKNEIDYVIMLRKEWATYVESTYFLDQRAELLKQATDKLVDIKASMRSGELFSLVSTIAKEGIFNAMKTTRELVHKLQELPEHLDMAKYCEITFDKEGKPLYAPHNTYHAKTYVKYASRLDTAKSKDMDVNIVMEDVKQTIETLTDFVKYSDMYEMLKPEEEKMDNKYEINIDNYLPLRFLGKSQGGMIGPILTMFNVKIKRALNGYVYDSKDDNTRKYQMRYDKESITNQVEFIRKYNPAGVPLFEEAVAQIIGVKKTKAEWKKFNGKDPKTGLPASTPINFRDRGLRNNFTFIRNSGGMHEALKKTIWVGGVLTDVTSYYPSLIIQYMLYHGRDGISKFAQPIYEALLAESTRLKLDLIPNSKGAEKAFLKIRRGSYKLGINITFGSAGFVSNPLYDFETIISTTMLGQMGLLSLILAMDPYVTIIQANTDGINHMPDEGKEKFVEDMISDWDVATKMSMENTEVAHLIQRDVNSYILEEKGGANKNIGEYKLYDAVMTHDNDKISKVEDYIVLEAVVKNLKEGIPVEDTIRNCDNFLKFTKLAKSGGSYNGIAIRKLDETDIRVYKESELTNKFDFINVSGSDWRKTKVINILPGGNLRIYKALDGAILTKVRLTPKTNPKTEGMTNEESNIESWVISKEKGDFAKVGKTTNKTGIANQDVIDWPKAEWDHLIDYEPYITEAIKQVAAFKSSAMTSQFTHNYDTLTDIIAKALKK